MKQLSAATVGPSGARPFISGNSNAVEATSAAPPTTSTRPRPNRSTADAGEQPGHDRRGAGHHAGDHADAAQRPAGIHQRRGDQGVRRARADVHQRHHAEGPQPAAGLAEHRQQRPVRRPGAGHPVHPRRFRNRHTTSSPTAVSAASNPIAAAQPNRS